MIRKSSSYRALWPLMTLTLAACSQASPETAPAAEAAQALPATTAAPARAAESHAANDCDGADRGHRDPAKLVQKLDANGNGVLELAELPDHKRAWLGAADTNKDGQLSVEEIQKHKGGKFKHRDPAAMVAKYDADGNGTLELSEVPERKREKLAGADANNDKRLSTEELKAHFELRRDKHRGDLDSKKSSTDVM